MIKKIISKNGKVVYKKDNIIIKEDTFYNILDNWEYCGRVVYHYTMKNKTATIHIFYVK